MKNATNILHKKAVIGAVLLCFAMLGANACKKSLSSVNTNHNAPTNAKTPSLLTAGEYSLANEYWGIFPLGYFGNLYSQYWSQDQYTDESRYANRASTPNDMWDEYYTALNTLQQIVRKNKNNPEQTSAHGPNASQIAVVKILKSWTFQTMSDIWGNIPYNEALQGAADPNPAYDTQKKVYASLIDTLLKASQTLKTNGGPVFGNGDVFYEGNTKQWSKFANSLVMRLAIRESDVAEQAARKAFRKAFKMGAMASNDDNALFHFSSNPALGNPIYQNYEVDGRDDWGVSTTLIEFMNSNNDPRRSAYAEPAINGGAKTYHGFPYGLQGSHAASYKGTEPWSRPSKRVRQVTAPAIFMTYSETLFNLAEAAQRGWLNGLNHKSAAKYYELAIQASMDYWDVDPAKAQKYIDNNPYQPNNWRQNIGRQKWVALYMQGLQGWSVWRRLDFGLLQPPVDGSRIDIEAKIPVRYPYPLQEHNLNDENLQAAIKAQGLIKRADQSTRLWWDVNPSPINQ